MPAFFPKTRHLIVLISINLTTVCLHAEISPLPKIVSGQLENGFRYSIAPLRQEKQRIDIRLMVNAGSIHEKDQQSGAAHLIEHMVFKGSEKYPQGVSNELHSKKWRMAQHYNAVTQFERTTYMMNPPQGVKDLQYSLEILKQMVAFPLFTQRDLDHERLIVLEEWRGKLGVAERMNQQRIRAMRHDSIYAVRPVIGDEQSIKALTTEQLKDYHQRWYRPDNMQLLVSGAVNIKDTEKMIRAVFSKLPKHPVESKPDYDPQLKPQLRILRLQDSESGSSQISWVVRFDDVLAQQDDQQGIRQRLLNQITLAALSRQMRRQSEALPDSVTTLVAKKSDIGQHTSALGIFAEVVPDHHQDALPVLLTEIQRLKQYPLADQDIETAKQDIQQTAKAMLKKTERREFDAWTQQLVSAWQKGWQYRGSQQTAKYALKILPTISVAEVNAHLQAWLAQPDQLLQYSIPGNAAFQLPSIESVQQLAQDISQQQLEPLRTAQKLSEVKLVKPTQSGHIVQVHAYPQQNVQEYVLNNGDRVIWLKTALAKDKVYLTAQNPMGALSPELNPWQSQLAIQMISQNGPQASQPAQFRQWKTDQNISLNYSQSLDQLSLSGVAPANRLSVLLQLIYNLNQYPEIESQTMKNSLVGLIRQQTVAEGSISGKKEQQIAQLLYGVEQSHRPTLDQLKQVNKQDLLRQWQIIGKASTTYFLISDGNSLDVEQNIQQFLAPIQREKLLPAVNTLSTTGQAQTIMNANIEPRADVRLWSFSEQKWQPETAVQVSIARQIAQQVLRDRLREESLGIYRLNFAAELNPAHDRIETSLSFTTSPERAQELSAQAQEILKNLPKYMTAQKIQQAKTQFQYNEQKRQEDIFSLQRRLVLSYQKYDSPIYLSHISELEKAISDEEIREVAKQLWNTQNLKIYISLPKK
ncbi:hypothetical protein BJI46_03820 [Acinetobacter qingfengensis]|uniref:Insulinase family protein n=2 Tax=Acinetobacter qingfengensis TaxID=1262585 RepID=A0A1E7R5F5_9GAMM|nr:hypothetical protein BJI46_03820 [Acinetobacter qingfengensis]